ncbi:serine/threonine-protein kinase [Chondromyces crocatus]|uniref:Protein kinase domain-containing protein n=1 Tax=Chondromyces crocatus TaxID=52 RepID=A0A0K1E8H3_CHOCO|nr:serine/threonine-protein kinase [Chondromyces crocatus]AKT37155.1 uncharacterized protein CMC5_012850 [Chondromyces crocatus]
MNDGDRRGVSDTLLWGTPYRVHRWLGRGGSGDVFEAEHQHLARSVVVKVLHPDLCREPRGMERMRLEAQVLARLSHPNLVAVRDFGVTAEGRAYLVMERLRGRTFDDELRARGKLPVQEAISYVVQALTGLAAVHAVGIVHRDVKLENLFVCEPDATGHRVVKLLDFGAIKLLSPSLPIAAAFATAQGVLLGSPRYLAPEQLTTGIVDARADLYAMGIALYALLTGRGPFAPAQRLTDILHAHTSEVPAPPSRWAPEIPPYLDHLVLQALEKDPAHRFSSAAAFATALTQAATAMATPHPVPAASRASSLPGALNPLVVCASRPSLLAGVASDRSSSPAASASYESPSRPVDPLPSLAPGHAHQAPVTRWAVTEPLDPRHVLAAAWPGLQPPQRRHGRRLGFWAMGSALLGFAVAMLLHTWH